MMVGRPVSFSVGRGAWKQARRSWNYQTSACSTKTRTRLSDVSMFVHEGEIVGVAGVQGNGQTELVDAIAGLSIAGGGTDLRHGYYWPVCSPAPSDGDRSYSGDRQNPVWLPDFRWQKTWC